MTKNLFSVPIFFIVFRETIEAAIIVATLLGLAKQIAYDTQTVAYNSTSLSDDASKDFPDGASTIPPAEETQAVRRLARKLKIQASHATFNFTFFKKNSVQIFAGAAAGFLIALSIGAAYVIQFINLPTLTSGRFIAVWFTRANDLYSKAEVIWEGKGDCF